MRPAGPRKQSCSIAPEGGVQRGARRISRIFAPKTRCTAETCSPSFGAGFIYAATNGRCTEENRKKIAFRFDAALPHRYGRVF